MKLVKPTNALKKSKRVGRGHGSGLGTTAGRGHKGAGQRSGHKYRFWFEGGQMPLHRKKRIKTKQREAIGVLEK